MNLEKSPVFRFFYQISKIPRSSGSESGMKNFLIKFATKRKLRYYSDEFNNVVIFKNTTNKPPIILQAHSDMVLVKSQDINFLPEEQGILLKQEGDFLSAKGTSLGADNGIGLAMILEILDKVDCNIEAVFTASEETTMSGAINLNSNILTSKKLLCLDGFEENQIIVSSAGFVDFLIEIPQDKKESCEFSYIISLDGLKGGHSGEDIEKNRGSSHKLMACFLSKIKDFKLVDLIGGHNYNIIPAKTQAKIITKLSLKNLLELKNDFEKMQKQFYPTININIVELKSRNDYLANGENIIGFINEFQQGVLKKENNDVILSQNISEIDTQKGVIKIGIRSCDKLLEEQTISNLKMLSKKYNLIGEKQSSQPAFNTLSNSDLLNKLLITNLKAKTAKKHFAVELGILQEKIKGLDAVIISPTIKEAHSLFERTSISSTQRTFNWILKFLNNI